MDKGMFKRVVMMSGNCEKNNAATSKALECSAGIIMIPPPGKLSVPQPAMATIWFSNNIRDNERKVVRLTTLVSGSGRRSGMKVEMGGACW